MGQVSSVKRQASFRNACIWGYRRTFQCLRGKGLRRFYPLRAVHDFVARRVRSEVALVHGHRLFLDRTDSLRLSLEGAYAPVETALMQQHIRRGDVVIDIGAHIGYYTLLFAKWVGCAGTVFAFEPEPANWALLQKNVVANGYGNVVLVQAAVADRTGVVELYRSPENSGMHRLYPSRYCDTRPLNIETVTLDDYFRSYQGPVHFIKMDVEGVEYRVLSGMEDLLKRNRNLSMLLEFAPTSIREAGGDARAFLERLMQYGFRLYDTGEAGVRGWGLGVRRFRISDLPNPQPLIPNPCLSRKTNLLCVR